VSLFNLTTADTLVHKVLLAEALHNSWLYPGHSVCPSNQIPDLQWVSKSLIFKYIYSMNWLGFQNTTHSNSVFQLKSPCGPNHMRKSRC